MSTAHTLPYDDYTQDSHRADITVEHPVGGSPGPVVRVGLSPFDIPDAVSLELPGGDELVFHFRYPIDERIEKVERTSARAIGWHFTLDRETRKVLSLRVSGAFQKLASGPITYDPSIADEWTSDLTQRARNIGLRNAALVAQIVAAMPQRLRRATIRALRDQATA